MPALRYRNVLLVSFLATVAACATGDTHGVDSGRPRDAASDAHDDVAADHPVETDGPFRCHADDECAGNPGGPACETITGRCVQCVPTNDTCPPSQHCATPAYACAPGCRSDEGCATAPDGGVADAGTGAAAARCDLASNQCVQCLADADCPIGTTCVGHVCAAGCGPGRGCPTGQACCAGACVDVQSNVMDCGSCDNVCHASNGVPACTSGACTVVSCSAGFGDCDHDPLNGCEADVTMSLANCGACGAACTDGPNGFASCDMGHCSQVCNFGFGDCDGNPANGCESTTTADPANCGACGHACTAPPNATATCASGACGVGACNPGFGNCDGNAANGCEDAVATDVSNCGSCGHGCPAVAAGTPGCAGGACTVASCNAGFGNCDGNAANGCETSTTTSAANCGACGHACAAGQVCVAGACAAGSYTSYAISRPSVTYIGACGTAGHASYIASADDATANATMPFAFRFYGTTTTNIWFSSNGVLGFGATPSTAYTNVAIPSTGAPLAAVFPYWDDLYLGTNGVCTVTSGTAPDRTFVVTWSAAETYADHFAPSASNLTFSVLLHEGTNVIDVVYNTLSGTATHGESATIGVQNETGTAANQFSFNTASLPTTLPTTVRFTPL